MKKDTTKILKNYLSFHTKNSFQLYNNGIIMINKNISSKVWLQNKGKEE
jgi:hypothetical protein